LLFRCLPCHVRKLSGRFVDLWNLTAKGAKHAKGATLLFLLLDFAVLAGQIFP